MDTTSRHFCYRLLKPKAHFSAKCTLIPLTSHKSLNPLKEERFDNSVINGYYECEKDNQKKERQRAKQSLRHLHNYITSNISYVPLYIFFFFLTFFSKFHNPVFKACFQLLTPVCLDYSTQVKSSMPSVQYNNVFSKLKQD